MPQSGQEIVSEDVRGSLSIADTLLYGIRAAIDVERAERLQLVGDAATTNADGVATTPERSRPLVDAGALKDTIAGLKWYQWGGLLLAGGLTYALVTGQFR